MDRIDDYTSQRLAQYASSIYEANRHTLDPFVIKLTCARPRAYSPITGFGGPAAPSAMLPLAAVSGGMVGHSDVTGRSRSLILRSRWAAAAAVSARRVALAATAEVTAKTGSPQATSVALLDVRRADVGHNVHQEAPEAFA